MVPPHRPIARSAIASKTGCTSVGELLMTRRISAVAVCCSSASLVSFIRRTFSIAITAWSAKVLKSVDLALRRLTGFGPADQDRADRHTVLQHRRAGHPAPRPCLRERVVVRGIEQRVVDR